MDKLKAMPKFTKEISLTFILYVVLWVLWNFVIKESIVLSDQGLSTIGLALSVSIGVLTAIVVSFVVIIWQWSREARSAAFWRWRNALNQLVDFFDANLEVILEISDEITELIWESAAVSLITPMPLEKLKALINKVDDKLTNSDRDRRDIEEPSKEAVAKHRAYMYISNYRTVLVTANFEHRISHDAYKRILRLEGLLYKLLVALTISIVTVAISVTTASIEIPDVFNVPLVAVLIGWFVYLLILLGREIKGVTRLEEQFRREVPPMEEIFRK